MTCFTTFLEKKLDFCVMLVYALNKPFQKEPLWCDLVNLSKQLDVPWCFTEDFNCILHIDEVKGGREHWTPDMQEFKNCLFDTRLDHIHTMGSLYT